MRRAFKWLAVAFFTPILLFIILTALLYCPPVQNWAVRQVASYASRQTGMDISIDNVRLAFPLDLEVNGFKMIKQPDTIADVRRLIADVSLLPLFHGQVEINALELNDAKVNTTDFIPSARVKGNIGRLYLQSRGIDLSAETVKINTASLEKSKIDVALNDSVPEDTTKSEANWKVDIVDLSINQTDFTLHMPGDSMSVETNMEKAVAKSAYLGLKDGEYKILRLDWQGGELKYDQNFVTPANKGFDASHIALSDVGFGIDSIVVATPDISMNIRAANFKEKSGLNVESFSSHFQMDETKLSLPDLKLKTPYTSLAAGFQMDLNTFSSTNPGKLYADVDGKIGKHDISVFAPTLPVEVMSKWPDQPLALKGHAEGNMQHITLKNLHATLPSVFDISGTGWVSNLTDTDHLRADLKIKGRTDNLDMITSMLPSDTRKKVRIPRGIGIDGSFNINGPKYVADFTASEGGGSIKVKGAVDINTMAYNLTASASNLQLQHFLPGMSLNPFSGDIKAQGHGTDFLNPKTGAKIAVNIRQFKFGDYRLDGIGGDINLANGYLRANVNSTNSMLGGKFDVTGRLLSNMADLHIKGHINNADLKQLGVVDKHYVITTDADLHVKSDMRENHTVEGKCRNFVLNEYHGKSSPVMLAKGDFDIEGMMRGKNIVAHFDGDINHADLYAIGIVDSPFVTSFKANLDAKTNLNDEIELTGCVDNLSVTDKDHTIVSNDIVLDILTRQDTTHAMISSGDFYLNSDFKGGYQKLMKQGQGLVKILQKQYEDKLIDYSLIREGLPSGHLTFHSGNDNFFTHILGKQGYSFRDADISLTTSKANGLTGTGYVREFLMVKDSIRLDSIGLKLRSDGDALDYHVGVHNKKDNEYPFTGHLKGELNAEGLMAHATIIDGQDKTGLDMSLRANMDDRGYKIHVVSDNSVIGYKPFSVNSGNYVYIENDHRVSADMKLKAPDGTGLQIYTEDEDSTVLQNITFSLHNLELAQLFEILPFTPQISGVLDGDYHVIQTDRELTVSSDMTVKNLIYEKDLFGDIGTQLVYMPKEDGSHYVDALISKDGNDVGSLTGTYNSEGNGFLDAVFNLDRFPLQFINGFIPDKLMGLRGTGDGSLTVKGPLNKLDINGEVYLDSSYLYSEPYGIEMRFANDPVLIKNSRLLFENFEMFANNDSPLNIQGYLDFSNMDRMMLDIKMRARNFQLIDAKENARSEVFGKAFVNFFATMNGPLNQLSMRGKLDVLGTTDMSYILKDSPLTTDNQLDELVKFTDFNDTIPIAVKRPELSGLNMDLTIDVSKGAHIMAYLNSEHSNFIDLMGGGTLRMLYDTADKLQLRGKYTLSNGEMKYSLPVIPLKTFTIQDGSYIEFTGNPMNPTLNIIAKERTKAAVSGANGIGRSVVFDCGVVITRTLSDMGLEFTLEAPEDMQLQNELNTMSTEQRGKLAVSMLTTGMYLADGNTSAFTMNSALTSFLNNEINNITGNALRTLDLSIGLDNSTDATGETHTDYSFKFAKRFWNNRLKISIGGKVSTGNEVQGQNQSFFDNVTLEYRLDDTANKYVTLFYQNNSYDWLEGYTQKYGGGFIWRRSLQSFKDIFSFKSEDRYQLPPVRQDDSLRVRPVLVEEKKDSLN